MPSIEEPGGGRQRPAARPKAPGTDARGNPFGRPVRFAPLGDGALMIDLADHIDAQVSAVVTSITRRLDRCELPGIVEVQPALASVLVVYDPARMSFDEVAAVAADATSGAGSAAPAHADGHVVVPVCFDEAFALDLAHVAQHSGLAPTEVVERLTATTYLVHAIGFLPGYAYLGSVPPELRIPRRATPRVRVPAGSVAIAGPMAAVYPYDSPGGWHIVGATPFEVFDASADPPSRLEAGDRVRFEAIDRARHRRLTDRRERGSLDAPEPSA